MPAPTTNHRKGLALAAVGGLVLSFDIPLIRLADGEAWTILLLRTATTLAAAILIWTIWRLASPRAPALVPGRAGAVVAVLYGLGSTTFVAGVYNTSTANVVFLLALVAMFAALLARVFLGERLKPGTLLAMVAMLGGVLFIVGGSLGGGSGLFGDAMALCSAVLIASAITVSRASGRDMGFTALVGVAFPLVLAAIMVLYTGYSVSAPWWIVLDGALVMPISFLCLAAAPRYIPGAEVAMFYLLETVLAPIWVWMVFAEVPTTSSLVGGAVLIGALVAHSSWQLHAGRRRIGDAEVRHPA